MIFTITAGVLFLIGLTLFIWAIFSFSENNNAGAGVLALLTVVTISGGVWFQTHQIVPVNNVGVSRSSFTQQLSVQQSAGVVSKPFFGSVYRYPAALKYERCEQFTPAIAGSYGITLDLCLYYNVGAVDWLQEIQRTGILGAGPIMNVWRNSIVGAVARSVKEYTPEALSDSRSEIEQALFENVRPWFNERGVELVSVSFKNWDFTSKAVAEAFDESIVSQRKIAEQAALLKAAKISREREEYEAETAKLVAEWQKEALNELNLEGQYAVEYLWQKLFAEQGAMPDVLILGVGAAPVAIPLPSPDTPATE